MRLVLVGLLVVLAGCPAVSSGPTPTELTPAPIPDEPVYPPGVDPSGVVDPTRLATAHSAIVDSQSHTLISNRTIRTDNGTLRSLLSVRLALGPTRAYRVTVRTAGPDAPVLIGAPPARAQYWANDSVGVRSLTRANHTEYSTFSPGTEFAGSWQYWRTTAAFGGAGGFDDETFESAFEAIPTRVAGTDTQDRTTFVTLVGDRARSPAFAKVGSGPVSNVSLRATVSDTGLIRRFVLEYERRQAGSPISMRWVLTNSGVGTTTAQRPPWFDRAVDQPSSATSTETPS